MSYWWVNHKQTRDYEVRGGYLWSPKRNANGARNKSYDNMALVRSGDIVFSYANGYLGAIGRAVAPAYSAPKPLEFGSVGDYWSNEGWLVDVHFVVIQWPIRPRDHLVAIGPLLPTRYSPIQAKWGWQSRNLSRCHLGCARTATNDAPGRARDLRARQSIRIRA